MRSPVYANAKQDALLARLSNSSKKPGGGTNNEATSARYLRKLERQRKEEDLATADTNNDGIIQPDEHRAFYGTEPPATETQEKVGACSRHPMLLSGCPCI